MTENENTNLSRIRENMSTDQIRANEILQKPGCNTSLNIIPIEEFNYNLNKKQFLDAVGINYQLPIPNLSTRCPCSKKIDAQHAASWEMGDFVTLRRNKLRDITGALLEAICQDVAIEPILQPVSDNNLVLSTANTNDVSARSF